MKPLNFGFNSDVGTCWQANFANKYVCQISHSWWCIQSYEKYPKWQWLFHQRGEHLDAYLKCFEEGLIVGVRWTCLLKLAERLTTEPLGGLSWIFMMLVDMVGPWFLSIAEPPDFTDLVKGVCDRSWVMAHVCCSILSCDIACRTYILRNINHP